jgi:myo-inositol-1-phosphate synthase
MAPNTLLGSSGYNTPESELESIVPVHPTAVRRPYSVVVQSENTTYSDDHITAKFVNRGASVQVVDGQYVVTPTVQSYEFQTESKVSKTG